MYRALPVSRHGRGRGLVKISRRRLATEASSPLPVPKKRHIIRRIFWATATLTGTFYVASPFVSFYNQQYYDFFSDHVPLGQSMLEYAESHGWDTLTTEQIRNSPTAVYNSAQLFVTNVINRTPTPQDAKHAVEKKAEHAKIAALGAYKESKAIVQSVATHLKTEVHKEEEKLSSVARHQKQQVSDELADLVRRAENALAGRPTEPAPETPAVPTSTPSSISSLEAAASGVDESATEPPNVYHAPLPLGFEPPPGFSRPLPPKKESPVAKSSSPPPQLPLIAPSISELGGSEPVISQLASTIDHLASYLNSNPDAAVKAKDVLETAKGDLTALAIRIEKAKEEERTALEAKLDEQTREYTTKLLELEMEAQDRLDSQSDEFRKYFDEEKVKFVQAYRDKLNHELRTQTELINERLKEEVIAQGIELQRRWIREIKVRVEQERGGRLSKINELSAGLKRIERIALDNSDYLEENIRVHSLWTALRALQTAADAPVRKPFREELRVLRHVAAAREDPVVVAALEWLESTDVPDVGIEPFADLASWFSTSVAPHVSSVALVPDQNAGVLAHLASHIFSKLSFKRTGLVSGSDVLSVLARAEYYMNEKDLDSATRELNQLKGTAKELLADWLQAARRRLEVQQALEVIQTQATLSSLLVV